MPVANEVSRDTLHIAKMLLSLKKAEIYIATLAQENHTGPGARKLLANVGTHVRVAYKLLTNRLSTASLKIVEEELMEDEFTLQIESITDMLLAMPKGKRDEIERHIEAHYHIYRTNL